MFVFLLLVLLTQQLLHFNLSCPFLNTPRCMLGVQQPAHLAAAIFCYGNYPGGTNVFFSTSPQGAHGWLKMKVVRSVCVVLMKRVLQAEPVKEMEAKV